MEGTYFLSLLFFSVAHHSASAQIAVCGHCNKKRIEELLMRARERPLLAIKFLSLYSFWDYGQQGATALTLQENG
jgi:hypothetical protein